MRKKRSKNYPVIEITHIGVTFQYQKQGLITYLKRFFKFKKYRKIKREIEYFNLEIQKIGFNKKKYNRLIEFLHQNQFIKLVPKK